MTTVRLATLRDAQALADLHAFVHEIHLQHEPTHFRATQGDEVRAWFEACLGQESSRIWLAETSSSSSAAESPHAVGYVLSFVRERPVTPFQPARRWYELDQIAVDIRYRKQGIASALVEAVLADARGAKTHDVELTCWSFNVAAMKVFEKFGFRPRVVRLGLER